jgi:hypothetical protein
MKTTTFIYLVTNCYGDSNKVYIGKTKTTRIHQHKKTYGNLINYIIIDEINSTSSKDWKPLECYWIEQFRQWGFDIQNKNSGGGGPSIYSSETRFQMSQSNKKHYEKGSERNKKISQNKSNPIWDNVMREKHSISLKGRILGSPSNETKLKISQANQGKKRTPEMIEKYRQARLGKKHSLETIEKLKGRIRTEESKLKQSLNSKGREITWDLGTKGKNIPQSQKNKIAEGNSKPVIQLDKNNQTIQEFKSYTEAKQITGIDPQHCLINKTKSAGGFVWKYKE